MSLKELKLSIKDLEFEELQELVQFVTRYYKKRREQVAWEKVHHLKPGDLVKFWDPKQGKLVEGEVKRPKKTRALIEVNGQLMDIPGSLIQPAEDL